MSSSNSHSNMVADIIDYISFLLGIIDAQDWIQLENIVLSNPQSFQVISESISDCEEFYGMTLLHACARYNPPVSILAQMIQLHPEALKIKDSLGRTPLHVAAGSGASTMVIKTLTLNYPQACSVQDEDGRTPLHFACDTTCELFEGDEYIARSPPDLETIRVLLSGSLSSVTLEDEDEMNAVEYAITSNASMEVVHLLQKATQRAMKKAKSDDKSTQIS